MTALGPFLLGAPWALACRAITRRHQKSRV